MIFREMLRGKQLLPDSDTEAVLGRCTSGVLACSGDGGYPYAVPLSYVHFNGKIYFHSAKGGHKIDAIRRHPRVSFAVIAEDTVVGAAYTSFFRSVIVFGRARMVQDESERLAAFRALVEKYSGDQPEASREKMIERCTQARIIAIDPEHITGKQAAGYVRERQ